MRRKAPTKRLVTTLLVLSLNLSDPNIKGKRLEDAVILLAKAPDVGRMDNTFHYINLYPVDSAVRFINSYPLITMYPLDSAMRHLKNWAQNYKLRIRDFTIAFYSTTLSISFFVTETR